MAHAVMSCWSAYQETKPYLHTSFETYFARPLLPRFTSHNGINRSKVFRLFCDMKTTGDTASGASLRLFTIRDCNALQQKMWFPLCKGSIHAAKSKTAWNGVSYQNCDVWLHLFICNQCVLRFCCIYLSLWDWYQCCNIFLRLLKENLHLLYVQYS